MADQGKRTPQHVLDRLRRLLEQGRDKRDAARIAGVSRQTVYRRIMWPNKNPPEAV